MTTQNVSYVVSAQAFGLEQIKALVAQLDELQDRQNVQNQNNKKNTQTADGLTKSLNKMFPPLKQMAPALNFLNMGWLATGTAITAAAVGFLQAAQAMELVQGQTNLASIAAAQYTGTLASGNEVRNATVRLSDKLGIKQSEIAKAFEATLPVTHSVNTSIGLINKAYELHVKTGIPLEEAIKKITGVFSLQNPVLDENGRQILNSQAAVEKYMEGVDKASDKGIGAWVRFKDGVLKAIEDLKAGLGAAFAPLLEVLEPLIPMFTKIMGLLVRVLGVGIKLAIVALKPLFDFFEPAFKFVGKVLDAFITLFDNWGSTWKEHWAAIWEFTKTILQEIWTDIVNIVKNSVLGVLNFFNELIKGVNSVLSLIGRSIPTLDGAMNAIRNFQMPFTTEDSAIGVNGANRPNPNALSLTPSLAGPGAGGAGGLNVQVFVGGEEVSGVITRQQNTQFQLRGGNA